MVLIEFKLVLCLVIKNVLYIYFFNIVDCGMDYYIVVGRSECDYG